VQRINNRNTATRATKIALPTALVFDKNATGSHLPGAFGQWF